MKQTKKGKRDKKKTNIVLGCLLLTFLASLPLFTDFLMTGTDLQYQLLRIEALRDGMKEAGILLWAKPDWIDPKGFSFAFFYGDTFLYIPALLRLIGVNVEMSYQLFLLLINAATVFGSYAAFRKIFGGDYEGLLGSALYSMSVYRVFLLYAEAELGESLALIFLPFVLAGARQIFYKQDEKENNGWLWLFLGFSGMLRSHILSFGIAVLFFIMSALLCMGSLKKMFVWKQLGIGMVAFLLLNLNYFYAILQYIRIGGFVINPVSGIPIQDKGVQIIQLFMAFYQAGSNRNFGIYGVEHAAPVGLGLVFLVIILAFCYLIFVYGETFGKEEKKNGYAAVGEGLFACFLSTLCFPWDSILKWSGFTSSWISMIQAPWHFLQAALLAFTVLGCLTYRMVKKKYGVSISRIYGLGLAALGCFSSSYLIADLMYDSNFIRVKMGEEVWIPVAEGGKEVFTILASGLQLFAADGIWYVLTIAGGLVLAGCVVYVVNQNRRVS